MLKYGGALSGEHGDGLVRSPFQEKMYGPVLYQAFRELKRAFDPNNLLNPGKIVDAPPLVAEPALWAGLRDTHACRQPLTSPPMVACCQPPSFARASAPAGRNAKGRCAHHFRPLAMSKTARGAVPTCSGWRSPVSLASRDSRILRYTTFLICALNARPARASVRPMSIWPGSRQSFFTSFTVNMACPGVIDCSATWRSWVELGATMAPLSNRFVRSGLARRLNEKLLGIDHRRVPPAFARRSLVRTISAHGECSGHGWTRPDRCCSSPTRSQITSSRRSAKLRYDLLERLGCSVTFGPPGFALLRPAADFQRTARPGSGQRCATTSNGFSNGRKAGRPIIACEPSCILTIRDDYPALLRGNDASPG